MRRLLASVFLCAACQPSAEATFKQMRASACAADVGGFFAHVDRTGIADATIRQAERTYAAQAAKLNPLEVGPFRKGFESGLSNLKRTVYESVQGWEDDVKRGEAGALCHLSVVSVKQADTTADVLWRTQSGKDKQWRMAKMGKNWMVVDIMSGVP